MKCFTGSSGCLALEAKRTDFRGFKMKFPTLHQELESAYTQLGRRMHLGIADKYLVMQLALKELKKPALKGTAPEEQVFECVYNAAREYAGMFANSVVDECSQSTEIAFFRAPKGWF
jgi:hypothetical protein